MADETTLGNQIEETTNNAGGTASEQDQTDYKALCEQLKAESRKWESRAKENGEKARAYDDLQAKAKAQADANKTLEQQVEEIRNQLNAANLESLRLKVAAEKGVDAALIHGSTESDLRDSADALLKWHEQMAAKPTAPIIPGDGKTPENIGKPSTFEQFAHNFFGGK